jgi:hypothetical protein
MNELLQEFVDSRGTSMRVDRQRGVIRGVKILGRHSRNGRTYLPEALQQAARLYEGAKVNVNHPKGSPTSPRDYQDRIGTIRQVVAPGEEGLFADFHFNPKHALAEQLAWDAEHAPENVGFSHNVEARTCRRGDQVVVEAITRVASVDLVADPATTRGLFESQGGEPGDGPDGQRAEDSTPTLDEVTVEQLRQHRPDLAAALGEKQAARIAALEAEIERLEAAEVVGQRRLLVRRLLREFHLPDPDAAGDAARAIVGQRFLDALMAAPDEDAVRVLVEERARLVRGVQSTSRLPGGGDGKPTSRERSQLAGGVRDVKAFVEAITSGGRRAGCVEATAGKPAR